MIRVTVQYYMTPILHRWTPLVSTTAVWHAIQEHSFCAIFEAGEWIIGALSSTSEWWYQGREWSNLAIPIGHIGVRHCPPFLEGLLTLLSFNGVMHAWYADYSIALHKLSGQWFCWGTAEQLAAIEALCKDDKTYQPTVNSEQSQHSMSQSEYCRAVECVKPFAMGTCTKSTSHIKSVLLQSQTLNLWLKLNANNPSKHALLENTH